MLHAVHVIKSIVLLLWQIVLAIVVNLCPVVFEVICVVVLFGGSISLALHLFNQFIHWVR